MNRHGVGGFDARTHETLGDNWPPELGEQYRDFTVKFQERTHEVLLKILRALAIGLGWEESFFDEVCLYIYIYIYTPMCAPYTLCPACHQNRLVLLPADAQ